MGSAIGAEREYLLLGSKAWESTKSADADAKKRNFSIHDHSAKAVRVALDAEGDEDLHPSYVTGYGETATGRQIDHRFLNHAEILYALERLWVSSESNYDRYLLSVRDGLGDQEIADRTGKSLSAIRTSLRRARRFMAGQIRDGPLDR